MVLCPCVVFGCDSKVSESPRKTSLLVARVKFEPESSLTHESRSSQVNKNPFFNFILISFACNSCFHNVAPTDAQNMNSPRDIFLSSAHKSSFPVLVPTY